MRPIALLVLTLTAIGPACAAGLRFTPHPSSERVRAMVTAGGKLWCATEGGVLVVSGARCERRITTADGLPGTEIVDLVARGPDVLAVTGSGVFALPGQAGERVRLETPLQGIRTAAVDAQDRLWVAGPTLGLTDAAGTAPPMKAPVRGILRLVRQGGLLWAAGPDSLAAWDGENWLPESGAGLPPGTWIATLFTHREQVYAGSLGGLWRRDPDAWRPVGEDASLLDVRAGASFRGELWVAAGSELYRSEDGVHFRRQLPLPGVTCLATMPAVGGTPEQLYAGTSRGLWRHAGTRWEPIAAAGPPGGLMAITTSGDELWVGSFSGETALLTGGQWREVPGPGPAGEGVMQLVSRGGEVWCRMSNGVLWRRRGGPWERVNRPWSSALGLAEGKICVGGLGAAWVLEGPQWRRIHPPGLGRAAVTAILRKNGQWWIGTQRGLYRERSPGKWAHYGLGTGLDDPWVTTLAAWRGQVWAGTFAGGLFVFERERWKPSPVEGLRQVTSLLAGERLWCAGTDGVWEREGSRWRRYEPNDGLASVGPYLLGTLQGRTIVASTGGVAVERAQKERIKQERD